MSDTAKSPPHSIGALPAGTRLGEFEIRRLLGVGGFGMVYLAFDHALEREVAVKEYMPASMAGRTETLHVSLRTQNDAEVFTLGLRSFVNEARLLARFDHPSLLKVHRFWEANNTAYMAMPVLRGATLRDIRKAGQTAIDEAWLRRTLMPLLGALEVLHAEGVYHRDVAPDNIQIEPDGRPVLLDFGAARRVIGDKTQTLTAILKPAYAPIEQYGETGAVKQGPWTDLYALGGTLHYMLLGQAPAPATARAITNESAGLAAQALPGCSREFLAIIDWMLEPRPADRPQSVAELRAVLEGRAPLPSRPGPAAPISPAAMAVDPDATVVRSPTVAMSSAALPFASTTASAPARPADGAPRAATQPGPTPAAAEGPQRSKRSALALGGMLALLLAGAGLWALRPSTPSPMAQGGAPAASAVAPAAVAPVAPVTPAASGGPGVADAVQPSASAAMSPPAAATATLPATGAASVTAAGSVPASTNASVAGSGALGPAPSGGAETKPAAGTSLTPTGPVPARPTALASPTPSTTAPAATATPRAETVAPARPAPARTAAAPPPPMAATVPPAAKPAAPSGQRSSPTTEAATAAPTSSAMADAAPAPSGQPAKSSRTPADATTGPAMAPAAASAAAPAVLTPEARCTGKSGLSRLVCMEDECLRSRSKNHPDCLAWRAQSRPAHAQP